MVQHITVMGLITCVALVGLFAVLARRAGWLGAIGIVFCFLFVGVFGLYFAAYEGRAVVKAVPAVVNATHAPRVGSISGREPWPMHANWSADRYPTLRRATEALAAHAVRELREGAASCTGLRVAGNGGDAILTGVTAALSRRGAPLSVGATDDPNATADAEHALLVIRDVDGRVEGELQYVPIEGDLVSKTLGAEYVDAPWVLEDPATEAGRFEVFVGRTDVLSSNTDARSAAEQLAYRRLAERTRAILDARHATQLRYWLTAGWQFNDIVRRATVDRKWRFEDPFTQTFTTEAGKLTRVAIRATPIDIDQFSRIVHGRILQRRQDWMYQGVALLILGGLTYLGYRVLDSGTRGHFTWKLRFGSLAAFVAAVMFVMLFVA